MSEEGINYPRALGRRNVPRSVAETLGRRNVPRTEIRVKPIGPLAMALVGGETPVHLAQRFLGQILPPRGTGLITGTARVGLERGLGRRLTEIERARRHKLIYGQLERLPILKRPTPVLDVIKERAEQLRGQVKKNIPPPYVRPMEWPIARLVERLPSAVADIRPTGPQRTVHPKKVYSSIHVEL